MPTTIKPGKSVLSDHETALLVEGLRAGQRENERMSADAARIGYHAQAGQFSRLAREFGALADTATGSGITRITVQHA